jgi:ABC-type transport system substrate-binding protein
MRPLVVGLAIMLVSFGWGRCSFGQEVPTPRGELRIVDKSPVNWISMTFNVFEHLMEADVGGELVPRLATSWRWLDDRTLEVTLRRGVTSRVRLDRIVLDANMAYWDPTRFPRLRRIIIDNTVEQRQAVELVKASEGRVDVVTEMRPLETLRVAESPFAMVVKNRGSRLSVFGLFNVQRAAGLWRDVRLRQAANLAINREDLIR